MPAKVIKVTKCKECPFVEFHCGGSRTVCNHIKVVVPKPYSQDRFVDAETIADFCPL